jgi:hypothetical protein
VKALERWGELEFKDIYIKNPSPTARNKRVKIKVWRYKEDKLINTNR